MEQQCQMANTLSLLLNRCINSASVSKPRKKHSRDEQNQRGKYLSHLVFQNTAQSVPYALHPNLSSNYVLSVKFRITARWM